MHLDFLLMYSVTGPGEEFVGGIVTGGYAALTPRLLSNHPIGVSE